MEWVGAHSSSTSTSGDYDFLALSATDAINQWLIQPGEFQEFFDEPTLVRQLITYTIMPKSIAVPSTGPVTCGGWMGVIVTAGGGNVPDPSIDAVRSDYDWAWWTPFLVGCAEAGCTTFLNGNTSQSIPLDIRSKRKIPNGHGLAFILSPSGANTDRYQFEYQWRGLFANR